MTLCIVLSTSSGVYICKSKENDLKHGNYICKSEEILPLGLGFFATSRSPTMAAGMVRWVLKAMLAASAGAGTPSHRVKTQQETQQSHSEVMCRVRDRHDVC
jgi:hypothetical protein